MTLFYVMGGGMGHLFRVSVLIKQLAIIHYKIVSANNLAYRIFPKDKVIFISPDNYSQAWETFVVEILHGLEVRELYVDSFPNGITGELTHWPKVNYPVYYLARRLKWENYRRHVKEMKLHFEVVYQLEDLEDAHLDFIKRYSTIVKSLYLKYPPPDQINPLAYNIQLDKPLWLVVHAFHDEELEALMQYAEAAAQQENCEPYFLVISDKVIKVNNGGCMRYYPAADWYPLAMRIFCGAGFNTVQQIKPFLSKTTLIPFPRKYDDQAWRVRSLNNK